MEVVRFGLGDVHLRSGYDALFQSCPNALLQQSTYWAEAIQDLGPDEPMFLLAPTDRVAIAGLPLYLFRNSHGNITTSVPQAGPLGGVFGRDDADRLSEARTALLEGAVALA